mmetsp:Transcript_56422/g.101133  ORF Transcript_56422/g.101133 Transcript_56422/m.101133 type:complete len:290 (-) Transcript_56422:26-895(-)
MAIAPAADVASGGPLRYLTTVKSLFCKRNADPTSTQITKVKSYIGCDILCTGRIWTGPSGGTWAELNPSDGGQTGWALVQGPGFGLNGPALVDPNTTSEKVLQSLKVGISKDLLEDWPTHPRSDDEWKELLSTDAYGCLRQKETEPIGTGEYNKFFPKSGHFACAGCNEALYSVGSKFDSKCGWPAFDRCFRDSFGRARIVVQADWEAGGREILCRRCGGHLGHVFMDGDNTGGTTMERHCTNSVAIVYREEPAPPPGPGLPLQEGLCDHSPFHRQIKAQVANGSYNNV